MPRRDHPTTRATRHGVAGLDLKDQTTTLVVLDGEEVEPGQPEESIASDAAIEHGRATSGYYATLNREPQPA